MAPAAEQCPSVSDTDISYPDLALYPGMAREPKDQLGTLVAQLGIRCDNFLEHAHCAERAHWQG